MKSKSLSCNIAIIPPPAVVRKAMVLSRRLKKDGGLFVLDEKKYFPHITLYMTEFPKKNFPAIKNVLQRIALTTQPFRLSMEDYYQKRNGYVDVRFRKNKNIMELHHRVVGLLNVLREGVIRPKDQGKFHMLSKAQQRALLHYGYRNAMRLFSPHLTFTKFFSFLPNLKLPKKIFSFRVATLGLFASGGHGMCRKLLASFRLS